ncbi:hypothetical protein KPSA3_07648 [Pseudomonas syringae pv. actinidiae]|uniref:Uncharacterized protein n=1 Tax=Pseudomonas syringae pv. actinidiae TaxID=103796 RepID=A0AAN4QCN6_PSESF|nr:hypothetical protein KPSA3_07648 [Pseudomonas syringae pv. actinidiae]
MSTVELNPCFSRKCKISVRVKSSSCRAAYSFSLTDASGPKRWNLSTFSEGRPSRNSRAAARSCWVYSLVFAMKSAPYVS